MPTVLEQLITEAEEEKKNLLLRIDLFETDNLATQEKNGNNPWIDTTESNLKNCRIDLGAVEERLAFVKTRLDEGKDHSETFEDQVTERLKSLEKYMAWVFAGVLFIIGYLFFK